ncbi:hypothetical protein [Dietzia timorensis]|uniref:Uncharacterized protein n=1 Tax=Dietzia timorensis TaxID=499555 RepID=A0A173LK38_9ACTN|nr:hypothetical protein [Dietzia timorensis]ANI91102.1 Hypothetical protein BJL86_0292 [Dietzia timorensis]
MSEASTGTSRKGRASMDIDGHRSADGTRRGHSRSRKNISTEAQRKTAGPEAVAWYAAQNPAVNIEKTYLNVDRVNDGDGGFRETGSIAEVVAYGDAREERVRKGIKTGERFAVTQVHHLPWSYVEEDGTFYQPRHRDGTPRVDAEGLPVMLPRYRVIPGMEDEARRYFEDCLEFDAALLPDGQKGIHGYSIQFDEHRPHLQVLMDAYYGAPTKKDAEKMENGYSRAFGSHRSDRLVPAATDEGKAIFNADGTQKMVREGNKRKFARYHREFKAFMIERGHQVEAERDELRHDRKLEHEDFKDWANEMLILEQETVEVEADRDQVAQHRLVVDDVAVAAIATAERTEMEAELVATATVQQAEEVASGAEQRGYRRGLSKGRSEGRATGRREGEEITARAEKSAEHIRKEADRVRRLAILETQRQDAEHAERMEALDEKLAAARRWEERAFEEEQRQVDLSEAARRTLGEAQVAKDAYEGAVEQIEINKSDLPHLREEVLEETRIKTKDGGQKSLAEIADRGAKNKLLRKYGPSADASILLTTRGQAERNRARAAEKVKGVMPAQGQQRDQRSSQGQKQ